MKLCKIYIPTETGNEIWSGLADSPVETCELFETYNFPSSLKIEPYKIKFNHIVGSGENHLKKWVELMCKTNNNATSYTKTIVVKFENIEYKLFGCSIVEYEIKNINALTRFIILEKENNFKEGNSYEITLNISSYSIGYD